jgi:LmbE family N-acetylglucosaminyl deacetylase
VVTNPRVAADPRGGTNLRVAADLIDAPGTDEDVWRRWPALGLLPRAGIENWASAVVIAAHPDDEVLGVGGTMALLAAAGARLRLVAVTDGERSHPAAADPAGRAALAARRVAETAAALRMLGAQRTEVIRLRHPDTGLAGCEDALTAELRELTAGFDVCLAPWTGDAHADHEAAGRAARRARAATFGYPVWMWHWARPDDPRVPWDRALRVPLPPQAAAAKQAAIHCFASQLEDREPSGQPVLAPDDLAHFARTQEVLLP